jgi:hypothetical protein
LAHSILSPPEGAGASAIQLINRVPIRIGAGVVASLLFFLLLLRAKVKKKRNNNKKKKKDKIEANSNSN